MVAEFAVAGCVEEKELRLGGGVVFGAIAVGG